MRQPGEQGGLIGMGGESSQSCDPRPHRHILAKQADARCPVYQLATQCSHGLESNNQDCCMRIGQPLPQVMSNPATIAHTASSEDYCTGFDTIEGN